MVPGQISVIPVDLTRTCGFWYSDQGACVCTVNRLYSTWCAATRTWRPQLKLCHLHAERAMTGKPVMDLNHEDRERQMLELSA